MFSSKLCRHLPAIHCDKVYRVLKNDNFRPNLKLQRKAGCGERGKSGKKIVMGGFLKACKRSSWLQLLCHVVIVVYLNYKHTELNPGGIK